MDLAAFLVDVVAIVFAVFVVVGLVNVHMIVLVVIAEVMVRRFRPPKSPVMSQAPSHQCS